jgi:hypothetical protein
VASLALVATAAGRPDDPADERDRLPERSIGAAQSLVDKAAPGATVVLPRAVYRVGRLRHRGIGLRVDKAIVLDGNGSVVRGDGFDEDSRSLSGRSALVAIDANGATLRNLVIEQAQHSALAVAGDGNVVEEVVARDCWRSCVGVVGDRNTFRFLEVHNSRHGSGLGMGPREDDGPEDNLIERSLFHDNGYLPDGTPVAGVPGDRTRDGTGGANSDGTGASKNCSDKRPANVCLGNRWVRNIAYRNRDDGFDVSVGEGTEFVGNIAYDNGPHGRRGFKMLRTGRADFLGNVVAGAAHERPIEYRSPAGTTGRLFHNTVIQWTGGVAIEVAKGNVDARGNFEDRTGTGLRDPAFSPPLWRYDYPAPTVRERWQSLYEAFRQALSPAPGSPLVDAGEVIAGYHCPAAGPGDGSCVPWQGRAPDLGAFESGVR